MTFPLSNNNNLKKKTNTIYAKNKDESIQNLLINVLTRNNAIYSIILLSSCF